MDVYARRRLVAAGGGVLVLILLIFGIAQCGDDDEETPITPIGATGGATLTALSKEEFIDEADAICSEANSALASSEEDAAGDPELLATQQFDIVDGELSQLQGLAPPEEDADLLDNFLSALEDRVRALRQQQLATERQDDAALAEAETALATADAELATAAEEFGFQNCGTSETDDTGTGVDTGGAAPAPAAPAPTTPTTPTPAPPADGGDDGSSGDGSGGIGPG